MELDTVGFVIIDANHRPFWIKIYHGKPRMFIWLDKAKKWVTGHPFDETKIPVWRQHAIPQEHADIYHKAHLETTGVDPTKF